MELRPGMTIREAGTEVAEIIIQETAVAYFHANPYVQYNTAAPLTVVGKQGLDDPEGPAMCTNGLLPEEASEDHNYYGVCRSYTADIFWAAFRVRIPGFNSSWVGMNVIKHPETIVYSFGGIYFKGEKYPLEMPNAYTSEDREEFLRELRKGLRPGDVILATPDQSTGNSGHLIMYVGDCFGTGVEYVTHCWPLGGGKLDPETGRNKREPYGAATFQTADEFLFSTGSSPNWSLTKETMVSIIVLRFLLWDKVLDAPLPEDAVTRYHCPKLVIRKTSSVGTYGIALPRETVTVTEKFINKSNEPYSFTVRESIPAGTAFQGTAGAEKISGNEIFWKVRTDASDAAEISYQVKITAKPGELITFAPGKADGIATRGFSFRVGASRLSFTDLYRLGEVQKEIPAALIPAEFEDLVFAKRVYRALFGRETGLPDTLDAFLKAVYDVREITPEYPAVLVPKEKPDGEGEILSRLIVPCFQAGKYFMIPGDEARCDGRIFDALEQFFLPGDVYVSMDGENTTAAADPEHIAIAVFLGNGMELRHTAAGTELLPFRDTVEVFAKENFAALLRPTYLF